MNTTPRPLLCFGSPEMTDALPLELARHGWVVHDITASDDCVALPKQQDFSVGLVHLDESQLDPATLRRYLESLNELNRGGNQVKWVALVSNAAVASPPIARMITTYFYDYHTLPVDAERLSITLGHAYGMARIGCHGLRPAADRAMQFGMVGHSPGMRRLFGAIQKVGAIGLNVMIRGESGTGKELTAQAIHRLSPRADGPFVAVNCAALPKELIQTELFGHEKGSFTGADRRRVGRIEAAQNGTLFLDEIGDLPLDLQVNLLRFLQEKTIDRIGGSGPIALDVRVIAATHVDLEKAVEEGGFREDLYYRLNVLHLEMPPLRERGEDIELLATHFLRETARAIRPNVKGFSEQALNAIRTHPWPGNVREMINRIQRAVVMCEGDLIRPRDLGLDKDTPNRALMTLAEARAKAEREIIETTLGTVSNNVSKAARRLDISRVTLYRLLEQHAIDWQKKGAA
ncbi:sigma-54 dependent transcriptional regulator [Thiococcus pfennigii]|uniref:sigma-54 dependent transcriptional regulator n=1 Tax=Thiococcus pfennigii TaxID=1057 RepID=UPI001907D3EB|nr:sigma-54 dependent transcriptional regulator [Thiococcus pfennigii]MBK1730858.1 sigma-54-dependent Fis family transcriptional regulator [Thiococcus pfennigii]